MGQGFFIVFIFFKLWFGGNVGFAPTLQLVIGYRQSTCLNFTYPVQPNPSPALLHVSNTRTLYAI